MKQYPLRLPLPRYAAYDTLTNAFYYLRSEHGSEIGQADALSLDAGDFDAFALLLATRASLCTPIAAEVEL